jgi:hypothetical protein
VNIPATTSTPNSFAMPASAEARLRRFGEHHDARAVGRGGGHTVADELEVDLGIVARRELAQPDSQHS